MISAAIVAILVLVIIALVLLILLLRRGSQTLLAPFEAQIAALEKTQERTERVLKDEIVTSRSELTKAASEQRQELSGQFKTFGDSVAERVNDLAGNQKTQLETFATKLSDFTKKSGEGLDGIRKDSQADAGRLREEVLMALQGITDVTTKTMGELANLQKGQLERMSSAIDKLSEANEKKLEALRGTVEAELRGMKAENASQLEQMRQTVDEKLQGTLEKRLGESFKQVSERLEQVHKGLGEMQSLATGVGDLKKVLTNVKARGTWGEVQLGALLEQVLTPEQYAKNVAPTGTGERVEFAIKLPGQGSEPAEVVWLPIDAKFPIEDYQRLVDAQERVDLDVMEQAGKALELRVKACAKDISEKYLAPPNTTDFGILFLPLEGLFAEIIRRPGLVESVQQNCRVIIAGPTTLWSILNSLQMGFRALAIQKRSSEVWTLLSQVKTEWTQYGKVLDAVHKKLQEASNKIEKVKVRSRAIGRKLKDVQELPSGEDSTVFPEVLLMDDSGSEAVSSEEEVVV